MAHSAESMKGGDGETQIDWRSYVATLNQHLRKGNEESSQAKPVALSLFFLATVLVRTDWPLLA